MIMASRCWSRARPGERPGALLQARPLRYRVIDVAPQLTSRFSRSTFRESRLQRALARSIRFAADRIIVTQIERA